MTYEAKRRVEASARTFAIVEHLAAAGPTGISAMATDLGMSKGIVHNHVSTLRELGYVTKNEDTYQLSPKFFTLGSQGRAQSALYQASTGVLAAYADRVDAGVMLMEAAGDEGVVIEAQRLPSATVTVGTALPLSASLPGIVLQFAAGSKPTAAHGYDVSALQSAFEADQIVRGAITADSTADCLAVPVTNDGVCHGSLAVVVPPATTDHSHLAESLSTLRAQIETRLQQDGAPERSFATEKHSWIGG